MARTYALCCCRPRSHLSPVCPLYLKDELKNGAQQMMPYPIKTSSASLRQRLKAFKIMSQGSQQLSLLQEACEACIVWEATQLSACMWEIKLGKTNLWAASLFLVLVPQESLSQLSSFLNCCLLLFPPLGRRHPTRWQRWGVWEGLLCCGDAPAPWELWGNAA